MSKLRQHIPDLGGDLESPAERDLTPWVVFTQLKEDGPHVYAGWLDAGDAPMALRFACEHYGQDQECVNIWAIPKDAVAGTGEVGDPAALDGSGPWRIFTQEERGDLFLSAGASDAPTAADAFAAARAEHESCHGIWIATAAAVASTAPGAVIWRYTDQTYRLARGYSKDVREKWEKIRAMRDIEEYEKEDLKETF